MDITSSVLTTSGTQHTQKESIGRPQWRPEVPVPPSPTRTSLNAGTPSGVDCPGSACITTLIPEPMGYMACRCQYSLRTIRPGTQPSRVYMSVRDEREDAPCFPLCLR